jgi:acetyl-CoA C-acetyltransferase
MSMAAHAIKHAVERAGVDKDYVEDCYLGNCAHGAPNIGRQAALLAGMPKSTAGVSVNRFCSSGLQTIAMAATASARTAPNASLPAASESISIPGGGSPKESIDPDLLKAAPDIFMAMIDTADIVASVTRSAANIRTSTRWNRSAAWPPRSRPTSSRTKSSR